jgi:hypothetical protein
MGLSLVNTEGNQYRASNKTACKQQSSGNQAPCLALFLK